MSSDAVSRVCVIGAGSSGIAACKVLHERGVPFDCFEKGSGVGGNWRYGNDNGMSSAYRSLFINTSRRMMEYASHPMPDEYPDYPHHTQIAAYFDDFVDHFGFRDRIAFRTEVLSVEPVEDEWEVAVRPADGGEERTRRYGAVMVASGHHWDPKYPEPPFPGQESYAGEQLHAHWYREPDGRFVGKNVLVLGIGNSACDIACESSRVSSMTFLAMRRGAHVLPKYLKGRPTDELGSDLLSRLPWAVQRIMYERLLKQAQGDMQSYGLPKPDHRIGSAHPTISSELLPRIGHGRIKPKPNVERIDGERVTFADGSEERIDTIVWCTGYRVSFPFLSGELIDTSDNQVRLYRRVVHPDRERLYFIGLIQPLGAIMPIAERQSEWIADVIEGKVGLPSRERMWKAIEKDERRLRKRYVASTRHTIQVDFYPYMRTLQRERGRRRGRARKLVASRSRELGAPSPTG